MSTTTKPRPRFMLHHRLALALEVSGVSAEEMANDLGVHINSIHNYASGRREPKLGMVKQWALRTGVDWEWLATGEEADQFHPDGGGEQAERASCCTLIFPALRPPQQLLAVA